MRPSACACGPRRSWKARRNERASRRCCAALREAFWKTVHDKEFRDEAKRLGRELIGPLRGEDVQRIVDDIYKTPEEFVRKSADVIK